MCSAFKEYTHCGTTLKGLARFDDCRNYGISEEKDQMLIAKEVDRLISAVCVEGPFIFQSDGVFKDTGDSSIADVSYVADQIRLSFEIIKHDNNMIVLEHCPNLVDNTVNGFKDAREKLNGRYKQDDSHVEGCQPKLLDPLEANLKAYFLLVDYVIASIARLLLRCATSKY